VACLFSCDVGKRAIDARALEVPPTTAGVAPNAEPAPTVVTSAIVSAARAQVDVTTKYDPAYVRLAYPCGDVPLDRGVCTDVVVRALRDALGVDLQQRVHDDMSTAFAQYPKAWGLTKTDSNIDHRRVPNLQRYFERSGYALPVTNDARDYVPGDLVTCIVPPHLPHIMIVSDKRTSDGVPFVIHNIGGGAQEEARLFEFPLTGHYRVHVDSSFVSHSECKAAAH
jgi:uncharacterized protein YijF (DUF1287 family)